VNYLLLFLYSPLIRIKCSALKLHSDNETRTYPAVLLLLVIAAFLSAFCGGRNEVRVLIAKAAIAGEHGRITLFDRLILTVPMNVEARVDDRTPRSLVGRRWLWAEGQRSEHNGSSENHTRHSEPPWSTLVPTPNTCRYSPDQGSGTNSAGNVFMSGSTT
jgi:hypothetical protein